MSAVGCTLTRQGYCIPLVDTDTDLLRSLRSQLTVTPRTMPMGLCGVAPTSFQVFQETETHLLVPRFFGMDRFGQPPSIDLPRGEPAVALSNFVGQLREPQRVPVEAFMAAADDPERRGGLLSLPCGAGKTVIALYVASLIARKTLIVAAKDFLLSQWHARIEEFLPDASVGHLRAQTCDVAGRDVVLVSLQSLAMKGYPPDLLQEFDLCIFDECHHLGAEVFSRALNRVGTPVCMGLSATLDRKDGLRRVFEWHLGPVVYEAPRLQRPDVEVQFLRLPIYGRERIITMAGCRRVNVAAMISDLCAQCDRTALMLDALMGRLAQEPGRRVLLLTDRRSHVDELVLGLVARGVSNTAIGTYMGGMPPAALKASESCDFIIGTFAMAAEGFDVPSLDTLLLASPVSSVEQAIGRIGRALPEVRRYTPVVIDAVDDFSVFRAQALRRKRFYVSRGFLLLSSPSPPRSEDSHPA